MKEYKEKAYVDSALIKMLSDMRRDERERTKRALAKAGINVIDNSGNYIPFVELMEKFIGKYDVLSDSEMAVRHCVGGKTVISKIKRRFVCKIDPEIQWMLYQQMYGAECAFLSCRKRKRMANRAWWQMAAAIIRRHGGNK